MKSFHTEAGHTGKCHAPRLNEIVIMITQTNSEVNAGVREYLRVMSRVWKYVRPYRSKFFLAIILMLLAVPMTQLALFLTRDVANRALLAVGSTVEERWRIVVSIVILQSIFLLASSFLWIMREVLEWYCSMRASYDMRLAYYRHLLRLPLSFLRQRPPGEHLYRATIDFYSTSNATGYYQVSNQDGYDAGVAGLIVRLVPLLLETLYSLVWGAALLYLIDPLLGILLLVYAIPYNIAAWFLYSRIRETQFRLRHAAEMESSTLRDSVVGLRTFKSLGRTAAQRAKFIASAILMRRENIRLLFQVVLSEQGILWLIRWAFNSFVYIYITVRVMHGQATIGDWLATILLLSALVKSDLDGIDPDSVTASKPMEKVVQILQRMRVDLVPAQRILETLDVQPTLQDKLNAVRLTNAKGHIKFENVSLEYIKGRTILEGISFEILPGEYVGFVGPSGAGKSSVLGLILRLFASTRGTVLIDGIDVNDLALETFLNQAGVVPQSTYIYDGTIAENIRFGRQNATKDELIQVCAATSVTSFALRQHDGLETIIGEGSMISGGERQRIGIARALIRHPKVLLLDEATANLDPQTEQDILDMINRVRGGRTVITVAHRLKAVQNCDKIIVLNEGRVAEIGTHGELLESAGLYKELWEQQEAALV